MRAHPGSDPTPRPRKMRLGSFQQQQQAIHGHEVVDADKHLFANFYVRAGWCACTERAVGTCCITLFLPLQVSQILSMKEDDIVTAWEKANISAGRRLAERDFRLSYILWRVWFLRRKKAQVEFEEAQRSSAATDLEPESMGEVSELDSMLDDSADETPRSSAEGTPPHSPRSSGGSLSPSRSVLRLPSLPDSRLPPLPEGEPSWVSKQPMHCVLISLHGLVRGDEQELGRDADTGGQVKYVVELARAVRSLRAHRDCHHSLGQGKLADPGWRVPFSSCPSRRASTGWTC